MLSFQGVCTLRDISLEVTPEDDRWVRLPFITTTNLLLTFPAGGAALVSSFEMLLGFKI